MKYQVLETTNGWSITIQWSLMIPNAQHEALISRVLFRPNPSAFPKWNSTRKRYHAIIRTNIENLIRIRNKILPDESERMCPIGLVSKVSLIGCPVVGGFWPELDEDRVELIVELRNTGSNSVVFTYLGNKRLSKVGEKNKHSSSA